MTHTWPDCGGMLLLDGREGHNYSLHRAVLFRRRGTGQMQVIDRHLHDVKKWFHHTRLRLYLAEGRLQEEIVLHVETGSMYIRRHIKDYLILQT
jgi:hypothetical protein